VGQSETEIRLAADRVLVIVAPGFGDEVQLLKAGLLEIANVFVVTKADRPGAAELHAALGTMVEEEMVPESGACEPRRNGVFLVSAQEGVGVVELADALDKLAAVRCPAWRARRGERTLNAVRRAIVSRAAGRLNDAMDGDPAMTARIQAVLDGSRPLDSAVQELLDSASRREKS
jgi:LAO/AO transport system kinase